MVVMPTQVTGRLFSAAAFSNPMCALLLISRHLYITQTSSIWSQNPWWDETCWCIVSTGGIISFIMQKSVTCLDIWFCILVIFIFISSFIICKEWHICKPVDSVALKHFHGVSGSHGRTYQDGKLNRLKNIILSLCFLSRFWPLMLQCHSYW